MCLAGLALRVQDFPIQAGNWATKKLAPKAQNLSLLRG